MEERNVNAVETDAACVLVTILDTNIIVHFSDFPDENVAMLFRWRPDLKSSKPVDCYRDRQTG
jgi:hypothetical protein